MNSINTINFFIDIGNSVVFNTPISFTIKYPQIQHYQTIITTQINFKKLLYKMISQQSTQIDLPKLIIQNGFKEEDQESITQVMKIKYNQYKKQLIKKQIYQGGIYLSYFNWKIKSVVGCSQFTHKNRVIIKLEFGLASGKKADQLETVSLQLTVQQARQLLNKLKQIGRQIKNVNF